MTVRELIARLQELDPEAEVAIEAPGEGPRLIEGGPVDYPMWCMDIQDRVQGIPAVVCLFGSDDQLPFVDEHGNWIPNV